MLLGVRGVRDRMAITVRDWHAWSPAIASKPLWRQWAHGQDIMKNGIDFHQFRYPLLRRTFRELGFREVYDRLDITDVASKQGLKRSVLEACKNNAVLKHTFLCFCPTTTFVCLK